MAPLSCILSLGATRPYSLHSPRIWLPLAVRWLHSSARIRWIACRSCCSTDLTATKRIFGRLIASQIASASFASFLLLFTYGLTHLVIHKFWPWLGHVICPSFLLQRRSLSNRAKWS